MIGFVFLEVLVLKFFFWWGLGNKGPRLLFLRKDFLFLFSQRNLFFLINSIELESPLKTKVFKTFGFPHWFESLPPDF